MKYGVWCKYKNRLTSGFMAPVDRWAAADWAIEKKNVLLSGKVEHDNQGRFRTADINAAFYYKQCLEGYYGGWTFEIREAK